MSNVFSKQQKAAWELIRADLKYLYTVHMHAEKLGGNYYVALMPYYALLIKGAEEWRSSVHRVNPNLVPAPLFNEEQLKFYNLARESIKLWDKPYKTLREMIREEYEQADRYFSSVCKPIARVLRLYDVFGVYTANGICCSNTVLGSMYLPGCHLGNEQYGPYIRDMAYVSGLYVAEFNALEAYGVNQLMLFEDHDYGGLIKSPVGNVFSDRFVLMTMLCQINFILQCVDRFVVDEIPAKLRFAYVLYYYICKVLPDINHVHGTTFNMDVSLYDDGFRNAMAHYKIGVYLKEDEIITDDLMFGMTQKAFGLDYLSTKNRVYRELDSLGRQIGKYLKLRNYK